MTRDRRSSLQTGAGILAVATVLRLFVASKLGILDDEAYYWTWSTRLAAGYFDHPPAIAWIIAFGTALFGKTTLGLRAGGILLTGIASATLLPLVESPALLAAILATMPLYALGGILATPDVPLLAGWMLATAGLGRFTADPRARRIVLAGLGGGLAALGKYTAWGFWPLAIAAALWSRDRRTVLGAVAAAAFALFVTTPNLLWEAHHDWISVRFQLHHGLANTTPPGLGGSLQFLAAQVALASPVLFVVGLIAARRAFRAPSGLTRLALASSLPTLGFFTFAASRSQPEVNWAAPAFVGIAILLAGPIGVPQTPRITRSAWVGVGVAGSLTALVLVHAFHPFLRIPRDPVARLGEGAGMADSVRAWNEPDIWATRYQEAALILWYDPTTTLDVTTVPNVDREDQFDLWRASGLDGFTPQLFVRPYRSGEKTVIDDGCERGEPNEVDERDGEGVIVARWQVYEVKGCARP